MRFGLEDHIISRVGKVFEGFPAVTKAILYGSRAMGNFKEGSDIDLCLYGDSIDFSTLCKIELALDDLDLPYTFDLTARHLLQNKDLIAHIDRKGVIFFRSSD